MIAYLNGVILQHHEKSIIVDVNGVGYQVFVTPDFFNESEDGETVELFIHTQVREDILQLFGFATLEEWKLFKQLITVSGVGPRLALDALSSPLTKLKRAIVEKDAAFLQSLPGIGKKTAERIALELCEKITPPEEAPDAGRAAGQAKTQLDRDIMEAIERFGYRRHHIERVLRNMPEALKNEEDIIKYFLQHV